MSSQWLFDRPLPPDGSDHVFEANMEQLHGTRIPVSTIFFKLALLGPGNQTDEGSVPSLLLTKCVTMCELVNFSEPQFSHL